MEETRPADTKPAEPLGAAAKAAQRGERFGMHHSFGLSRGNVLTWVSAALLVASAVLRIVYYAKGGAQCVNNCVKNLQRYAADHSVSPSSS